MILRGLGQDGNVRGLMLSLQTGMGKTRTAIVACLVAAALAGQPAAATLVLAPLAVLRGWFNECRALGLRIGILVAHEAMRKKWEKEDAQLLHDSMAFAMQPPDEAGHGKSVRDVDFILMNHDMVANDTAGTSYYARARDIERVIVDESHAVLATADIGRYNNFTRLLRNIPVRFLLTATPFRTNEDDILPQVRWMAHEAVVIDADDPARRRLKRDVLAASAFQTPRDAMRHVHIVQYGPATVQLKAVKTRRLITFPLSDPEAAGMDVVMRYCKEVYGEPATFAFAQIMQAIGYARQLAIAGCLLKEPDLFIAQLEEGMRLVLAARYRRLSYLDRVKSAMSNLFNSALSLLGLADANQLQTTFDWIRDRNGVGGVGSSRCAAFRNWLVNDFLSTPSSRDEKVVVFSYYKESLSLVKTIVEQHGEQAVLYHGDIDLKRRDTAISEFNTLATPSLPSPDVRHGRGRPQLAARQLVRLFRRRVDGDQGDPSRGARLPHRPAAGSRAHCRVPGRDLCRSPHGRAPAATPT